MGYFEILLIVRCALSLFPMWMASKRGRNYILHYILAMCTSPIIWSIVLLFLEYKYVFFCSNCNKIVFFPNHATKPCPHCNHVILNTGYTVHDYQALLSRDQQKLQNSWKSHPENLSPVFVPSETPVMNNNNYADFSKTFESPIRHCEKCGETLDSDSVFCPNCGEKVT